tara:strand:- start:91 stop:219 length:129 start_codon:yes stop_codon:yes gene_type:complete
MRLKSVDVLGDLEEFRNKILNTLLISLIVTILGKSELKNLKG